MVLLDVLLATVERFDLDDGWFGGPCVARSSRLREGRGEQQGMALIFRRGLANDLTTCG